jgi:hypothetical protein
MTEEGGLSEEERARLMPVLEAIEKILRPRFNGLPHDAMPWTSPYLASEELK